MPSARADLPPALQRAGLLVLADDRTNWEYQRALRGRADAAYQSLLPVTRDFDRIWYGHRRATRAEYDRAVAAHDALPDPPASTTSGSRGSAHE